RGAFFAIRANCMAILVAKSPCAFSFGFSNWIDGSSASFAKSACRTASAIACFNVSSVCSNVFTLLPPSAIMSMYVSVHQCHSILAYNIIAANRLFDDPKGYIHTIGSLFPYGCFRVDADRHFPLSGSCRIVDAWITGLSASRSLDPTGWSRDYGRLVHLQVFRHMSRHPYSDVDKARRFR